ncbi:hypothetical protein ACJ5NV_01530 [Loktanella agnita]|uniref:hypothetical protein n=1 Tax=Loktanella agnita TaxID=287097 RepID=UPI0039880858
MNLTSLFAAAFLVALQAGGASAQQSSTAFYIGGGVNNESKVQEIDDTPFVIGMLAQLPNSGVLFGFDIAGEGEMLDSTYGSNGIRQAFSFNVLFGGNLMDDGNTRIGASLLLGMRETFADCPDSYLGYQCYADREPDTDYDLNYGGLLSVSFDNLTIGVRATEVSTQAVVGLSF